MLLLDASLHPWLEDRGPELTLLGFLDDATRKVPVAEFFLTEDAHGLFSAAARLFASLRHSAQLLRRSSWRFRS